MSENTTTAVAPAQQRAVAPVQKKKTLRDHLESPAFLEQIAKALPKHMKPERMARVAITAMTRTPLLNDCTPESFCKCLLDLSALGLEPDGRRAHLIPFRDNRNDTVVCTLIVDYKGLAELAYNSGVVSYLHADVIREGDLFEFSKGELRQHVPWFMRRDADKPSESGPVFAAYALARLKDGSEKVDVLSLEELNAIRDASQGYKQALKYGKPTPWTTNETEMQKKTAFRRLTKWLPLSPEIRDRLEVEDEDEVRFSSAKPAQVATPTFLKAPQERGAIESIQPPAQQSVEDSYREAAPAAVTEPPVPRKSRRMEREQVAAPVAPPTPTSNQRLAAVLGKINAEGGFGDFKDWCETTGISPTASNWTSADDVPVALAERLLAGDELADFAKKFGGAQ